MPVNDFLENGWTVDIQGGPKSKPQTFVDIFAKYVPILRFFFTGAFCGKCVIKWLLSIPPHLNCVATLPCEI